jgi:chain length determinant protein tyrosine kinase EpsG
MKREFDNSSIEASLLPLDGAKPSVTLDRRIGEILQRVGRLAPAQIEQTRALQLSKGSRFGEAAVELGLVTDAEVRWALSQQFHYPYALDSAAANRPELVVASDPFCAQAEAIRDLRSQLLMGVLSADHPARRALAIVSPDKGDGKSFFAANMAVALSQLGARTLLVDADMRTPRQHLVFGMDNASGLSSILSGRSETSLTGASDFPNLYVLPVGTVPPNPIELVLRPAFKLLMREFLGKFDYVLVDTPAAAHGTDVSVIAATSGAALAIGREGRTSLASMARLLQALSKVPTQIAGVVMNQH